MNNLIKVSKITLSFLFGILISVPLFAVPATLSLGRGMRPGLKRQNIAQAANTLRESRLTGWSLIEAARKLVQERMAYSRRNSFDIASKAFERGYGYCQQQAYALADILTHLGFDARVVGAFRNRLPDGRVGGHAWVRVIFEDETRNIDTLFYDELIGNITFTPLSAVFDYTPAFRVLAGWGSISVNAYRYYRTGKDREL